MDAAVAVPATIIAVVRGAANWTGSRIAATRTDADPQVRRRSLEVLMWHGGDPAVMETISAISREDRHEAVQQHAAAILPKVQHFAREAEARAEGGRNSK